jgi:hypothetical protein
MKIKVIFLVFLLFFFQNLFAKKSNILNLIVNESIENKLDMEYYFQSLSILTRYPYGKEELIKDFTKHEILKIDEYKDFFQKLKKVKLKELDPQKVKGLKLLIFLKKQNEIIYTIELSYMGYIGINDKRYKFNEEFKEIISRIIPEYYGEEWKEEWKEE